MAEWKNIYVTKRGQLWINRVAAGYGKISITRVTSSSEYYSGEYPLEANELKKPMQNLTDIRWFQAPNNPDSTAFRLEAVLDNTVNRVDASGNVTEEKNDSYYYLRQVGVFATFTDNNGATEPESLLVFSECTKDTSDPNTEKMGADLIPSRETPIRQTYAIQFDNFGNVGDNVDVKVEAVGAGLLTRQQMEEELMTRYTNPELVGNVIIGDKALTPDYNGRLVETSIVKSIAENDIVLFRTLTTINKFHFPNSKFGFKVSAPVSGDYLLSTLVSVYLSDLTEDSTVTIENKTTGEIKEFKYDDNWISYTSNTSRTLNSLTTTFNLVEGENEFEYTLSSVFTYLLTSVRRGNSLMASDYHVTYSPLNCSDFEGSRVLGRLSFEIIGVDDEIRSYLPIPIYEASKEETPDSILTTQDMDYLDSVLSSTYVYPKGYFYRFKGFTKNAQTVSADFRTSGWYILTPTSTSGLPSEITDLSNYRAFLLSNQSIISNSNTLTYKKFKRFDEGETNYICSQKVSLEKGNKYTLYVQYKKPDNPASMYLKLNGKVHLLATGSPISYITDSSGDEIDAIRYSSCTFVSDVTGSVEWGLVTPESKLPDLMAVVLLPNYNGMSKTVLENFTDIEIPTNTISPMTSTNVDLIYAFSSTKPAYMKQTLIAFGLTNSEDVTYTRYWHGTAKSSWKKECEIPNGNLPMSLKGGSADSISLYIPQVTKGGIVIASTISFEEVIGAIKVAKNPTTIAIGETTLTGNEPAGTIQFVVEEAPPVSTIEAISLDLTGRRVIFVGEDDGYEYTLNSGTITVGGVTKDISKYIDLPYITGDHEGSSTNPVYLYVDNGRYVIRIGSLGEPKVEYIEYHSSSNWTLHLGLEDFPNV